ncbi:uncharacterized protein P884DRAFT_127609 [Thermothelomyces heterothallicus CBS 202.75]|uniref:uncharacterized protein n=1 Tax=Thermothelomyces heterothallicus CBS 202.75 TaxID=1149848 RepID=UPI0037443C4F
MADKTKKRHAKRKHSQADNAQEPIMSDLPMAKPPKRQRTEEEKAQRRAKKGQQQAEPETARPTDIEGETQEGHNGSNRREEPKEVSIQGSPKGSPEPPRTGLQRPFPCLKCIKRLALDYNARPCLYINIYL